MIWLYILILVISGFILIKAGSLTVKSLTKIAQFLKWGEFLVAFVLMAFITTFPELFVGITSAFYDKPQLAFGNIIGSNIVHLTLLVTMAVLLGRSLKTDGVIVQRTSIYTGLIVFLPIILLLDGTLSRLDGLSLLLALFAYFQRLFYHKKRFAKILLSANEKKWVDIRLFLKDLGLFFLGVVLLLLSVQGIVWSSLRFASEMGLSLLIFGAVILGLGTNMPEIIFGIKATRMGRKEMVLGNIMGAVAVNSGLVLGISALISPFRIINLSPYIIDISFVLSTVLLFVMFTRSGKEISRKEGLILLFIYLAFVAVQFLLS